MMLLRTLRHAFSGGQTNFLEAKMQKFTPRNEDHIYEMLHELYAMREYLPFHTPTFSLFVSNIQAYYIRLQEFDRRSLRIYTLMEKMEMMTENTKRIFHKNISKYLSKQRTLQSIKNQRLEHLLWWLYRQFPFQFKKFEEVASNYTVRLYDVFEYMNTIDRLPAWEPYIRVSYMLKALGHDLQCRTDMFNLQVLDKIDRHYFIYLLELFTPQQYPQFVKQLKIHNTLLEFLSQNYLIGDDIDYDKYLQRIEVIDNISANEEINCTMDSILWRDLVEGWKLAAHAYREGCLTQGHEHKFTQMFWRKLQTSDIPVQETTILLKLLIDHPTMFFQKRQSIIMRMVESVYEKRDEQLEFFAANGYAELMKITEYLPMDGESIKKFNKFLYEKVMVLLNWDEGDAEEILGIVERKEFQGKKNVVEFLENKKKLLLM